MRVEAEKREVRGVRVRRDRERREGGGGGREETHRARYEQ